MKSTPTPRQNSRSTRSLAVRDGLEPFTPREWNPLARKIHASTLERPGALLERSIEVAQSALNLADEQAHRISGLLERAGSLAIELERLQSLGIWSVTQADDEYPARFRERLVDSAPCVLFGAGDKSLAGLPGLAVVGSRDVNEIGQAAAQFLLSGP